MKLRQYKLACIRANVLWQCGHTDKALLWEHISMAILALVEGR